MLSQSVGDIIAPESQTLADFFALSEARLNDHGLTIDLRVNDSEPFCAAQRSFGVEPFKGYQPGVSETVMSAVVSRDGVPIATVAGIPMVLDGTLAFHLACHGIFPGETQTLCNESLEIGETITSGACFTGGFAITPELRGTDLSKVLFEVLPVVIRAAAWGRYQVPSFFMVPAADEMIAAPAKFALKYRAERLVPQVIWSGKRLLRWFGYASPEYTMKMVRGAVG